MSQCIANEMELYVKLATMTLQGVHQQHAMLQIDMDDIGTPYANGSGGTMRMSK